MKKQIGFSVVLVVLGVAFVGCEWTGTNSAESWSDSYSWINFSGLYRGSGGDVVRDFGATGPIGGGGGGAGSGNIVVVINENAGTAPQQATVLSGVLAHRPGIVPGSLTLTFQSQGNQAAGSARDDGSGGLAGTYNVQGADAPVGTITGTIDYNTGAWTVSLSDDGGFALAAANIRASYAYDSSVAGGGGGTGGDGGGASIGTLGGRVNSMQIEQLGNKLTFRLSSGHVLSGRLSVVTLPGGDQMGRSAGDVSATYEVSGDIDGHRVRISGTLSGVYVPPADIVFANPQAPIVYGILSNRIIQGIWMQPNGTADVYGVAPQQSVPVNVGDFEPFQPPAQNGEGGTAGQPTPQQPEINL